MTHYTNSQPDRARRRLRLAERHAGRAVEQDRRLRRAGLEGLGARRTAVWLPARHPGLVQPVHRGGPRRSESRLRRPRRGLRDRGRRLALERRSARTGTSASAAGRLVRRAEHAAPPTTHPDQHSIAIGGGTRLRRQRRRRLRAAARAAQVNANGNATDWRNLNANLRTLQYYSVGGRHGDRRRRRLRRPAGQRRIAAAARGSDRQRKMGSPFGGDGGDSIVDPDDGCKILDEYVFLAMWLTENCGALRRHRAVGPRRSIRAIRSRASSRRSGPTAGNKRSLGRRRAVRLDEHKGFAIQTGVGVDAGLQQRRRPLDDGDRQAERRRLDGVVRPVQHRRLRPRRLDQCRRHVASAHAAGQRSRTDTSPASPSIPRTPSGATA